MAKAAEFATGHHDRVTVLHTNFDASRILTGSIDHRIKVWNRNPKTGERTLLDTFTAHDSDIRDVSISQECQFLGILRAPCSNIRSLK